jgi:5-methylcytosine-specific restriction protein A
LSEYPLCEDCEGEGIVEPAIEVHHLVKIKYDPAKRLDETNVVGLCGPHHDARTARGE